MRSIVLVLLMAAPVAAQSAPLGQLWEYQRVDANDLQTLGKGQVQEGMNQLGSEGWELVSATALGDGRLGFCFFKRPKAQDFVIRQVRMEGGERIAIRLHPQSGESWSNSTKGDKEWTKIAEPEPNLPLGNYEVLLLSGPDKDSFWTLRYDRVSGKTWSWAATGWVEFAEP